MSGTSCSQRAGSSKAGGTCRRWWQQHSREHRCIASAVARFGRFGRGGEAGLTTLEWLLVVAAVAGLAAVAVVLVQNVVGDTAEQVASNDARQTAADLAVTELQRRWQAETPTASNIVEINRRYENRCRQLGIIYADIGLSVDGKPGKLDTGRGSGWIGAGPQCTLS